MIDANAVEDILKDCLFVAGEVTGSSPPENCVMAEGIVHNMGFHRERLESHRDEVAALLADLPGSFQAHSGGGMSFLQACVDRDGNQWGEHRNVEQLMVLGIALGLVRYCMPRAMWSVLPGGMPYFVVLEPEKIGQSPKPPQEPS